MNVLEFFDARGHEAYYGEPVSQTEHALQAAALACQENAPDTLIVAALLHDIGHLLYEEGAAEKGHDMRHEDQADEFLRQHFPPSVTEPVRLHVAAKRYLCAVESAYRASLSPASELSLQLQGGPMSPEEVADFESNPYFQDAVRLRRWDDTAKDPNLEVPGLQTYADLIRRVQLNP